MARRSPKPLAALSARNADRHALYEIAVQRPDVIVGFIEELFAEVADHPPITLREDFCGTAYLSSMWVRSTDDRRAIAVDIDGDVLDWAQRHNVKPLGDAARRLTLIHDDVMRVRGKRADVLASLNFSHFIYKHREDLVRYLRHARQCLAPGGMFICDAFGGPGSIEPCLDERRFGDFEYQWEQRAFNPLTNEIDCRIHFRFRNGTAMRDAFTYDWRMWSLPELVEALDEAGFGETAVYFESEDGFIGDTDVIDLNAWVAYVVALRE